MAPIAVLIVLGLVGLAIFVVVRAVTAARPERLATLERHVRELARRLETIESQRASEIERAPPPLPKAVAPPRPEATRLVTTAGRSAPPPLPPAAAPPAALPSVPRLPLRARPEPSLENFLGGRVLLVVGVVVVLFGLAFFLKFAIDRGWITAGARIVMGLVTGVALLAGGDHLKRRGFDLFGQALMGCGLGALYLTNFFACTKYSFITVGMAFGGTAAITLAGSGLALLRRAPALAWLGFLGGYLAPALLAPEPGDLVHLTSWLLWLDAGALLVLLRRDWRGLDLPAVFFAIAYFDRWLETHRVEGQLASACGCVAALVAASLVLGIAPAVVRRVAPPWFSLLGVALAVVAGVLAGHHLLFPEHRTALAGGVAALAAACFTGSRLVARRVPEGRGAAESLLGFAAGALTTAVVLATRGLAVAPVLSIMGVAIVLAGTRTRHPILLASGVATIFVACGNLLLHHVDLFTRTMTPFLNERFLVFAAPCAALLAAGWLMNRQRDLPAAAGTAVAAIGLALLPIVLAADSMFGVTPADPADLAQRRELMFVAPTVALAAFGLLAAHLFPRAFELGRDVAMVPLFLALLFATTLFTDGHLRAFTFGINPTFAAGLSMVAAAGLATLRTKSAARSWVGVLALIYLLGLVTAEIHAWGRTTPLDQDGGGTREEAEFRATVWISIAWAIGAALLVATGFWRRRPALRWMGLALFAATILKVVLVEMAQLAAVYRIGSFLVLGALLLTASFLYQRAKAAPAVE